MTKWKRKAPADAPSTLKEPGYRARKKAEREAEEARYNNLCGEVVVTRKDDPNDTP